MKKGSNHQQKEEGQMGVLSGNEEYTEGVDGAQNKTECQINTEERRPRLKTIKSRLRSANVD
jgi:hypothetical protein